MNNLGRSVLDEAIYQISKIFQGFPYKSPRKACGPLGGAILAPGL